MAFSRTDPNGVGVAGSNGQIADGKRGLLVKDRTPCEAAVLSLPNPSGTDPRIDRAAIPPRRIDGFNPASREFGTERLPRAVLKGRCGSHTLVLFPSF